MHYTTSERLKNGIKNLLLPNIYCDPLRILSLQLLMQMDEKNPKMDENFCVLYENGIKILKLFVLRS